MTSSIMLVDDDPDILNLLADLLRTEGYLPRTYAQPTQALDSLLTDRPALLVTDLLMPGMSGEELVARVREQYGADLPIAVMSASVATASAAALPIQAYLSKPFELDDFMEVVARLATE
ncbi:MAG TPA: response regulator [Ktedonobacterales bacterium]|nr:response regulator [Ktedonobacterales bacterium]